MEFKNQCFLVLEKSYERKGYVETMKKTQLRVLSLVLTASLIMLMTGGVMAAQPDPMTNHSTMNNSTTPGPNEVPLGSTPNAPAGSSNLDLQMSTNSNGSMSSGGNMGMDMGMMNQMMGMEKMMMGNMSGMMGMENMMMGNMGGMMGMGNMNMGSMNMSGSNDVNTAVLAQLQASNTAIMQMLFTLSGQPNNSNLQPQIQALYQMLANQNALIQMLNTNSMNMNSGQSNMSGSSMSGMGGMGMMM